MNNLRSVRRHQGLAQYGLAVRARVSPSLISGIERWDYVPTPTIQSRIAAALEVAVEEIWPVQADASSGR